MAHQCGSKYFVRSATETGMDRCVFSCGWVGLHVCVQAFSQAQREAWRSEQRASGPGTASGFDHAWESERHYGRVDSSKDTDIVIGHRLCAEWAQRPRRFLPCNSA